MDCTGQVSTYGHSHVQSAKYLCVSNVTSQLTHPVTLSLLFDCRNLQQATKADAELWILMKHFTSFLGILPQNQKYLM
jgi:hypothetical protein